MPAEPNVIIRPCAACGKHIETRRKTSTPTCSMKCYMTLYRAKEQPTTTSEEQRMKREQPSAEAIQAFVNRNIGRLSIEAIAEHLGIAVYIVKRFVPASLR